MRIDPRTWLRLPLPTMLIGLGTMTIGVTILCVAIDGTRADELLVTPARAPAALVFDVSDAPGGVELAAIQSQPLLHESRTFFVPPSPDAAPAAPPRPNYRLAGVLVAPNKPAVALLTSLQGGTSRRVKPGDDLEGWHVQAVDRKQVTLVYENESFNIATPAAAPSASAGLKRVPISRARVASAGSGVQSLSVTGNVPGNYSSNDSLPDPPRLYRPPPQ